MRSLLYTNMIQLQDSQLIRYKKRFSATLFNLVLTCVRYRLPQIKDVERRTRQKRGVSWQTILYRKGLLFFCQYIQNTNLFLATYVIMLYLYVYSINVNSYFSSNNCASHFLTIHLIYIWMHTHIIRKFCFQNLRLRIVECHKGLKFFLKAFFIWQCRVGGVYQLFN